MFCWHSLSNWSNWRVWSIWLWVWRHLMIIFHFPESSLNTQRSNGDSPFPLTLSSTQFQPGLWSSSVQGEVRFMPAVRPRLCVWVGREMWVTQRTVTAGYYTIGDGWHAGGSGHERCVLVGNPHASSASRILLNGRLGARGFTGHGSSQAEVANGHIGPGVLSCQLARRRLFTHTFTR